MIPPNHSDKRQGTRQELYLEDGIAARLKIGERMFSGWVYDLNPQGVGLLIPPFERENGFERGEMGQVQIDTGNPLNQETPVHILNVQKLYLRGQDFLRIGASFQNSRNSDSTLSALSYEDFFVLLPDFQPFASAMSPLTFRNVLSFKVVAIHGEGMILTTSKRNRELFPGLRLTFTIQLLHLNQHRVEGVIEEIAVPSESRKISLKVRFKNASYSFYRDLSEYLLRYSDEATPKALRKAKIPVKGIDTAIRVSYAKTEEEMHEVLRLRHQVAVEDGRISQETPVESLRDVFDDYSRQLLFWVGSRPIACARLIFVDGQKERSEISTYIQIPEKLWKKKFVEISRFAIHPDFRGGDVYINMIRHSTRIPCEAGMDYALADCRPFLLKVYKRIGATDTGLTIAHPFYPGEPMHLIYFDAKKLQFRARGNFAYWSRVMMPIFEFGSARKHLSLNPLMRAQILLGKLLNWGSERWEAYVWNRSRKKGGRDAAQ